MKFKLGFGATVGAAALVLMAGPAFAHECTNASKNQHNPAAGAKAVLGCGDTVLDAKKHALKVFDETGEVKGYIAIDIDCDGVADVGTFLVGKDGELPLTAQHNGSPDHGIVNICDYLGQEFCEGGE